MAEARSKTKEHQQKACRDRGAWTPASIPEDWFSHARVIGLFSPRTDWDEPETFSLPSHLETAYPLMNGNRIEFRSARSSELRTAGRYGLLEPAPHAPLVTPDLLLVPCLFMDRLGRRIGRGGGFYDRFLTLNPHLPTVGVLHSDYLFERLPDAWLHGGDRPLSAALTESSHEGFTIQEILTRRNPT